MYDILNVYLENGLQVIMHRVPFSKTMACGLWIKQGSKHESEPELGLFHLIEHLMINTENFNNPKIQQLMKEVSSEGVSYNAGTTKEATAYYFSGLIDNTDKCLEVLSVIATYRNSFPIEVFEKEKRVVVQEAISFYSSFSHIKERMTQALWGNNGIGNIIVGSLESVKAAKLEDVDDIIEKSYTPENSLLVIVGGIDYNSTLDMVSRHFSSWKDSETRAYKDKVDSEASVYFNQTESSTNSVLSIGFRVGEYDNRRRTELELLT